MKGLRIWDKGWGWGLDREEKWRWDWLKRGIKFEGWDEGFGVRDWLG